MIVFFTVNLLHKLAHKLKELLIIAPMVTILL